MPEVTDERIVKEIHAVLKSKSDLAKHTFTSFTRFLEKRLNTSLTSRNRFLSKSIDGHLLEHFDDVSPAEEMVVGIASSKLPKLKGKMKGKELSKDKQEKEHRRPSKGNKPKAILAGAPKKPPTAFIAFTNEKRAAMVKENPGLSIVELSAKFGEMWRGLKNEEKQVYENQYAAAFKKWEADIAKWKEANPEVYQAYLEAKGGKVASKKQSKRRRESKGTVAKQPRTQGSYFLFRAANRQKLKDAHADLGHKELEEKLASIWAKMSPEEKKTYEDQAAKYREKGKENGKEKDAPKSRAVAHSTRPEQEKKKKDGFINDEDSESEESASGDGSSSSTSTASSSSSSGSSSGSESSSGSDSDSDSGCDSSSSSSSSSASTPKPSKPAGGQTNGVAAKAAPQTNTQEAKRPSDKTNAPAAKKKRIIADDED
eukprot:GGOE01061897.1.p1 GENE.GGOE01061897.1~~GGOE01061897.1.p1  ORF type:complete len:428 (-),score=105.64 GGOE01061897.1:244-1527(-)